MYSTYVLTADLCCLGICLFGVSTWMRSAYVKKDAREEVKLQVSTCVWVIPLILFKTLVTKTTALHLPAASQHSVFLAASLYESCPVLIHAPASTLTVVNLTRPCYTLLDQIVPLSLYELCTSLLYCFIDSRCFSIFQIERLSVPHCTFDLLFNVVFSLGKRTSGRKEASCSASCFCRDLL